MKKDTITPLAKTLARHISADELGQVSGAGTVVRTPAAGSGGTATEETYKGNSKTPSGLDTIIETP